MLDDLVTHFAGQFVAGPCESLTALQAKYFEDRQGGPEPLKHYFSKQRGSLGEQYGFGAVLPVVGVIVVCFEAGAAAAVKVPANIKPAIATKRVFFMVRSPIY